MLGGNHVASADQLLPEPDRHGGAAGFELLHLVSAHGDASLGPAAFHRLGKLALLAPVLDRARRDVNHAAISASVHCSPHSFSNCSTSIFSFYRPEEINNETGLFL